MEHTKGLRRSVRINVRRSSIWFFGTIFLILLTIPFQIAYPGLVIWNYVAFWWITLLPFVMIKVFYRNSKLFKWLNKSLIININIWR